MSPGCSLVREALSEGFLDSHSQGVEGLGWYSSHGMYRGRWGWGGGRTGAWVVPSRLAKYNTESMRITVTGRRWCRRAKLPKAGWCLTGKYAAVL